MSGPHRRPHTIQKASQAVRYRVAPVSYTHLDVYKRQLFSHITTRESTQEMADDLFDAVTSGKVKIRIDQQFPLEQVQQAHIALEARQTTGCTILTL